MGIPTIGFWNRLTHPVTDMAAGGGGEPLPDEVPTQWPEWRGEHATLGTILR